VTGAKDSRPEFDCLMAEAHKPALLAAIWWKSLRSSGEQMPRRCFSMGEDLKETARGLMRKGAEWPPPYPSRILRDEVSSPGAFVGTGKTNRSQQ